MSLTPEGSRANPILAIVSVNDFPIALDSKISMMTVDVDNVFLL